MSMTVGVLMTSPAARADGLPGRLLASASSIPADLSGRQVCLPIDIGNLRDQLQTGAVLGTDATSAEAAGLYLIASSGIYLGDGPTGAPAPPFVEALLDAGAAKRLRLTWIEHRFVPDLGVPRLADVGTGPGAPPPPPGPHEQAVEAHGDAYVVIGRDEEFFRHDEPNFAAPSVPRILVTGAAVPQFGPPPTEAPPGIRNATRICYLLIPDRVLEYGDPHVDENGVREVSAAILFHPTRMPSWISDVRVIDAMPRQMAPNEVRVVTFRDDGDGWRPEPGPMRLWVDGPVHLVGQD